MTASLLPQRAPRRAFKIGKLRMALMLFGLLLVIGLTADLVSLRLRAEKALHNDGLSSLVAEALIDVTTATNRWSDPAGRFSLAVPPTWTAFAEEGGDYDVTLRGPLKMELNVALRPAGAGGMDALLLELGEIETNLHLLTSIQADTFQERPAWRRVMPLQKSKIESLDFVRGDWSVHLLMAAPRDAFDELRPVLVELRNRFELETPNNVP